MPLFHSLRSIFLFLLLLIFLHFLFVLAFRSSYLGRSFLSHPTLTILRSFFAAFSSFSLFPPLHDPFPFALSCSFLFLPLLFLFLLTHLSFSSSSLYLFFLVFFFLILLLVSLLSLLHSPFGSAWSCCQPVPDAQRTKGSQKTPSCVNVSTFTIFLCDSESSFHLLTSTPILHTFNFRPLFPRVHRITFSTFSGHRTPPLPSFNLFSTLHFLKILRSHPSSSYITRTPSGHKSFSSRFSPQLPLLTLLPSELGNLGRCGDAL